MHAFHTLPAHNWAQKYVTEALLSKVVLGKGITVASNNTEVLLA